MKHFVLASTTDLSAVLLASTCKFLFNGRNELVDTNAVGGGEKGNDGTVDRAARGGSDGSDRNGGTTRSGGNRVTRNGGDDGRLGGGGNPLASREGGLGSGGWEDGRRWARKGFGRACDLLFHLSRRGDDSTGGGPCCSLG